MNKVIEFFGHKPWAGLITTVASGGLPTLAKWTMAAQLGWYVIGTCVGLVTIYSFIVKNFKKRSDVYKPDKSLEE